MKNIHVLSTDKPSRLYYSGNNKSLLFSKEPISFRTFERSPQHIYITSDEEIKEGDWYLNTLQNTIDKCEDIISQKNVNLSSWLKKIILTTDQDLIKDGVQAIDDEFLEWFVKNPSCEEVVVIYEPKNFFDVKKGWEYKIIIPKEELCPLCNNNKLIDGVCKECTELLCKPFSVLENQETLEEVDFTVLEEELIKEAKMVWKEQHPNPIEMASFGAKWQQERSYSVGDMAESFMACWIENVPYGIECKVSFNEWFEQFKKK
jgi:hypothetical protein